MSGTAHTVTVMSGFIPLPQPLEGARLVEVDYTPGDPGWITEQDWPIIGWDEQGQPVVIADAGHRVAKMTAEHITPTTTAEGDVFFLTRYAASVMEVASTKRALRQALERHRNELDTGFALRKRPVRTIELPVGPA